MASGTATRSMTPEKLGSSYVVTHSVCVCVCWSRLLFVVLCVVLSLAGGALTAPVPVPDLSNCLPAGPAKVNCCMLYSSDYVDFTPPSYPSIRVRRAAHLVSPDYMAKYKKAIKAVRDLPASDPRSFKQQANVHCAYCSGGYKQTGYDVEYRVHETWLFFPFHRAYIYFYERILGKLIGDDTFALHYWNWDAPDGMKIPSPYLNESATIFDPLRNPDHLPPTLCNLAYDGINEPSAAANVTHQNLVTIYKQTVVANTAAAFMGHPYYGGDAEPGGIGSFELCPHNTMHTWIGDPGQRFIEDMGDFYSAALDPVFFSHHANIDRMWEIWKTLPGGNRKNFNSTDWLNSAFFFWDENKQLVRVKVSDVLETEKLGYAYEELPIPWTNAKPEKAEGVARPSPTVGLNFPIQLDKPVSVKVDRPTVFRRRQDKVAAEEFIVVFGIKVGIHDHAHFDVYVNAGADDKLITPASTQFAGSFVSLPMMGVAGQDDDGTTRAEMKGLTKSLMLGITELLDDLGVDGDESIVVTLVPRLAVDHRRYAVLTIGGIKIELSVEQQKSTNSALEM